MTAQCATCFGPIPKVRVVGITGHTHCGCVIVLLLTKDKFVLLSTSVFIIYRY